MSYPFTQGSANEKRLVHGVAVGLVVAVAVIISGFFFASSGMVVLQFANVAFVIIGSLAGAVAVVKIRLDSTMKVTLIGTLIAVGLTAGLYYLASVPFDVLILMQGMFAFIAIAILDRVKR